MKEKIKFISETYNDAGVMSQIVSENVITK
jgi:hypothetical protein